MKVKKNKRIPKSDIIIISFLSIILLGVFAWAYLSYKSEKNIIEKDYVTTKGVIISNEIGVDGGWDIGVKYKVNDICYLRNFYCTWCSNGDCIGDSIQVEYSSKEPNISRIIQYNGKVKYPITKLRFKNYIIDCSEQER